MHKKIPRYPFTHVSALLISCVFTLLVSCASRAQSNQPGYVAYKAPALFFSFEYFSQWSVLEEEENIRISNNVRAITAPTDEQALPTNAFLGNIRLTDTAAVKTMYADVFKYAAFLRSSKDSVFAVASGGQKNSSDALPESMDLSIYIGELQRLADTMSASEFTYLRAQYKTQFDVELSNRVRAYVRDKLVILIDIPNDSPPAGNKPAANTVRGVSAHIAVLMPVTDSAIAVFTATYTIETMVSSAEYWQAQRELDAAGSVSAPRMREITDVPFIFRPAITKSTKKTQPQKQNFRLTKGTFFTEFGKNIPHIVYMVRSVRVIRPVAPTQNEELEALNELSNEKLRL